ncbi:class B sortase [Butyrivibrio fibrisolvens]|uniref:class B sortase n=1 Tax=Butyrivibrio fibrisolvens TaxID=831 RepID=UPI00040ABEF7|nr:class B sortase [Butyrivibrio fibrisolvens]
MRRFKSYGMHRKALICTVCSAITISTLSGCSFTKTISDENTPLSDNATYESTVAVLEQGYAESFITDLEEGEVLVGSTSDAFECQGKIPDLRPDWDSILAQNSETVAYLVIPEAGITVPVMQKEGDQDYYDTHNAKGNIQEGGALHLDIGNTTDYTDPNTIIYGSNEEGGPLEYLGIYANPEYFEANPFIYLYVPGYVHEFRVFAAMSGYDTDILTNTNCYDFDFFSSYVNNIYSSRSMDAQKTEYLREAVVNGWRMLTISAGSTTDSTNRYFVYSTYSGSQIQ